MTHDNRARNFFGALAFGVAAIVIAAILSPYVPKEKEGIANLILGNVLGWPMMVLAYHYGSSSGSKAKDYTIASQTDDTLTLNNKVEN